MAESGEEHMSEMREKLVKDVDTALIAWDATVYDTAAWRVAAVYREHMK